MMNHEAKTKEQLIIELEELKQNYNSLKASYENDMAKSRQNEIDLQISEAQKKAILNGITSNISFVDKELKIIWANKTAANSVNKTPDEMIGKTCHHFWGDPSKPCENCPSLKAFDSKKSEHLLQYTPDGSIWDERGEPVFDVEGNMIGVVEIATDITEYKKAEKEKEQVQKLLEDTQKIGKIGGWEFDIDSMELKWTREMYHIHEVDPTFNPTTNERANFYSPESLTIIDKAVQRAIEFGEPYEVDLEIITAKGNKRSIKTIGKPDLENRRIFGLFQDITDHKKAEAALAQSRSELKAIYDLSPVMMCLVNDKRKIIFANRAFTNLTGTDEILLQGGHACGVFGCINATDDIRGCGFGAKCRNCSLRIAMEDTLKNGTGHLNVEYHTTLVQNGETRQVSLLGSTALIENNEQRNLLLCLIDITERKKAEELLQKSQINLKNAQHLAQLGSWEWDMMSNMFTFSDEFYQIFGLNTEKQVINVDLLIDYIHPDDKEFYIGKLAKCLRTGESESFEYRIVRPDGEIRYLYASGNVIFDENNKPVKGTGVIQDITKRKKGVEALRESEKKYRLLTEFTADVVWILNLATGKFTYISPSVFQLRGITAEEAMFETLESALTPDSITIVNDAIAKNIVNFIAQPELPNHYINEVQQYCKNGEIIWVEVSSQFRYDPKGDIEVVGVSRNIDERKKAENTLRASEEKFKTIIETSPDGIAITALDGTIQFVTAKVVSMWGYGSEDEIIGRNTLDFIHPDYHEKANFFVTVMFNGQLTGAEEYLMMRKDGSTFYCESNANILRDAGNNPTGILYIERDITERKRTEVALKESEEKFRTVFYISPDAITLSRLRDNVIVSINKGFTDTLGYSEEDVMGKTSLQIDLWVDPKERSRLFEILKKTGKVDNFEAWFYTKRKEIRYGLMSMTILDINGEKHLINITRDITDRKQAEQVLSETNAYLENLINYANAPIIVWDPQFRITRFNHAFEHLTGLTEKDVLGQSLEILFPPELAENSMQLIYNTLTGERWETVEIQIRHNDNSVKTVLWNSATLFASDGKTPIATIAQGQDITMRKLAEEALKNSEEHFRNLFVNAPVGIFHSTWDGQFLAANPALAKILEYSNPEELILTITNMNTQIYEDPKVRSQVMDTIKKTSGWVHFDEINWRRKDNYIITVDMTGRKVFDSSGNFVYLEGFIEDITERKKTEALLLKAKQEAESANKAKSIFLANMSHEIRTPLNAIIGFTQLMNRDKDLTDTQKEYNASIIRSGEHLLMLISDILELSKMEAGRVVMNPVNVDLPVLFNDIQSIFKEKAQSKHLRFVFKTAENIPRYVLVDERKLRQIFINLIGNALKFTDHGGIEVSAFVDKVIEGTNHLFVKIEDSGSGIAENELNKLFNHFTQTSAGISKGSGTGLGLALSRELAILMGGNITVSSKVGKGSIFSFHVEIQDGQVESLKPGLAKRVLRIQENQKPCRILVVDDKQENLQVVVTLLNLVGFETIEAVNGEDAISKFGEYFPDLILMDLRMPVMDGYEAIRRIKLTEKGKQIPIIALTASALEGYKNKIETLGIQGYISKPFREAELFGTIGKVLGISYEYEDEMPLPQNVYILDEETVAADIDKLPEGLKLQMLNAAAVADINLLKNLISSIHHDYAKLALHLMNLAKNYDYDNLLKLLKNKGE